MRKFLYFLFSFALCLLHGAVGNGQERLPLIRASSPDVAIRDGENYYNGLWKIMPELRPDIYVVEKGKDRRVSFITDRDSISFFVQSGQKYEFMILLNGKDTAYTTIYADNPNKLHFQRKHLPAVPAPDTIPFTFGRGGKIYIEGRVNRSAPLKLMFDTGSDQVVISRAGQKKGAGLQVEGKGSSVAFGGASEVGLSYKNSLELGNLQWKNVPIAYIEKADADGIVGYHVFEGKIVEIDFDHKWLLVHDSLPAYSNTFSKLPMSFRNNLPFLPISLLVGGSEKKILTEYDSGSAWALFINDEYATDHLLYELMHKLENRSSFGMGSAVVESQLVLLPGLSVSGHFLECVPIDLEKPSGVKTLDWAIMGMDLIRRFNVILDYKDFNFYLEPNSLINSPYVQENNRLYFTLMAAGGLFVAGLLFWYLRRRKKYKREIRIATED